MATPQATNPSNRPAPAATPGASADPVIVRPIRPEDSISDITRLLHRAYAKQVAMGMKPLAGRQDDSITRERAANSECYLALVPSGSLPTASPGASQPQPAERIVGVILFEEHEKVTFPPFFLRPEVAHFAQFGVDPDTQGKGIGRLLLATVERRARENKALELACSMAEPDRELFDFYIKRGYRLVDHWQWPYTNYRSCILSKSLA